MVARYSNAVTNLGYGSNVMGKGATNLGINGPNGYILDTKYYAGYTDYIRNPARVQVLQAPLGLQMMPNASAYVAAYKNLIENWMHSWSGFNRTLSVESTQTEIGNSGEKMETPTRVSRAPSNIQSTIVEKIRRPVIRFLEDYVRYLIQDPQTGHPLLTGVSTDFVDHYADIYSGIILVYEPDRTFRYVENAFLFTNFYPKGEIGENIANKQLQQEGEKATYSLNWTGISQVGWAVDAIAQAFIDANTLNKIDPSYQQPITSSVDSNVKAISTGYYEAIADLKSNLILPKSYTSNVANSSGIGTASTSVTTAFTGLLTP